MLQTAELLRRVLVPFLSISASLLGVLFAWLLIQRAVRELRWRRHQTLLARYRPIVDAIMQLGPSPEALARLREIPPGQSRVVAELLLAPLHVARGEIVLH